MLSRLKLIGRYSLFLILFQWFIRFVFLVFHFDKTQQLPINEWFLIFVYGFKLDCSVVGYFLILPFLILFFTCYFSKKIFSVFSSIYIIFILFVCSFFVLVDLELYTHWGFRLDTTPLLYIDTPKEMMASVDILTTIRQIFIGLAVFSLFIWFYYRFVQPAIMNMEKANWKTMLVILLITITLAIPIRGGFSLSPVNISSAYFSKNNFANNAAVNLIWNIMYSVSEYKGKQNPAIFMEEKLAENYFQTLKNDSTSKTPIVLNTETPNIVFIVIESFTNQLINRKIEKIEVTPNFNKLVKEGIFFKNIYASGDRSDKGLASIFASFPTVPCESVLKYSNKTQKLPYFNYYLKENKYSSTFIYGGDINFANFRAFFVNGKFDLIISDKNFPENENTSKWGVHDEFTFNRLLDVCNHSLYPFFNSLFTLSSHNPFDVPMKKVFQGDTENMKFVNSIHYTDKCLGIFIDKAKQSKWWKNTLLIIIADHSLATPDDLQNHEQKKFHIPMLWLGGALAKTDTVISTIGSQTDISATLLPQLRIKNKPSIYSKDLLNPKCKSFAYYAFTNGVGFITDSTYVVWDNGAKTILEQKAKSDYDLNREKAFYQILYNYFINL